MPPILKEAHFYVLTTMALKKVESSFNRTKAEAITGTWPIKLQAVLLNVPQPFLETLFAELSWVNLEWM